MRTTEKSEYRYTAPTALGIAAARRPLHKNTPHTRHAQTRDLGMDGNRLRTKLSRLEPIVQERARQRVRIVQANRQLRPRFAETKEKSRISVVRQLHHAERLEAGDVVVGVGVGYLNPRDGVDARTGRLKYHCIQTPPQTTPTFADPSAECMRTNEASISKRVYLEMVQPREERRVYKLAEHVGRVALVIARTVVDGETDERRRRGQNVHDAGPARLERRSGAVEETSCRTCGVVIERKVLQSRQFEVVEEIRARVAPDEKPESRCQGEIHEAGTETEGFRVVERSMRITSQGAMSKFRQIGEMTHDGPHFWVIVRRDIEFRRFPLWGASKEGVEYIFGGLFDVSRGLFYVWVG
ncbi:hypothetical protein B0H14DRAFT_3165126 [Mycena olivaceomarginata]|nr:hypothetical protein B0H14DRAFT_3165126 [Mycena olivaceomarginata]